MGLMSISDNLQLDESLAKIARTDGTLNGASVATGKDVFQRAVALRLGTWTDGVGKWTVQESSDDSVWVTLPARQLYSKDGLLDPVDLNSINVVDATQDDTTVLLDCLNTEEFLRVVNITTGATSGAVGGADILSAQFREAGGAGQPMSPEGFKRTDPQI